MLIHMQNFEIFGIGPKSFCASCSLPNHVLIAKLQVLLTVRVLYSSAFLTTGFEVLFPAKLFVKCRRTCIV